MFKMDRIFEAQTLWVPNIFFKLQLQNCREKIELRKLQNYSFVNIAKLFNLIQIFISKKFIIPKLL